MSEKKVGLSIASGEEGEMRVRLYEGDVTIDIDDIGLEFEEGQAPRLTSRIEINFEASERDLSPFLLNA